MTSTRNWIVALVCALVVVAVVLLSVYLIPQIEMKPIDAATAAVLSFCLIIQVVVRVDEGIDPNVVTDHPPPGTVPLENAGLFLPEMRFPSSVTNNRIIELHERIIYRRRFVVQHEEVFVHSMIRKWWRRTLSRGVPFFMIGGTMIARYIMEEPILPRLVS